MFARFCAKSARDNHNTQIQEHLNTMDDRSTDTEPLNLLPIVPGIRRATSGSQQDVLSVTLPHLELAAATYDQAQITAAQHFIRLQDELRQTAQDSLLDVHVRSFIDQQQLLQLQKQSSLVEPSTTNNIPTLDLSPPDETTKPRTRRSRLRWTDAETEHLIDGCNRHGVGNWKKILNDPAYHFISQLGC